MSSGRTVWWSKDASWWERERIVLLGEKFGPAGPAVVDWLTCQAKKQNAGGQVRAGFQSIARGAFVDNDTARAVIAEAVDLGFLDDFVDGGITFHCRISGWAADQEIAGAAVRQRRYRERIKAEGADNGSTGPLRERVFERDGRRCLCCGSEDDLVVDHVVPRSKGGNSGIENLQTLCDQCNKDKGTSSDDYRDVTSRVTSVPQSHVNRTGQDRTGGKTPLPPFPEDFPPELLPHCRAIYRILSQLAERHGGKAVVPLSLAQVVMARRHKPLVRAAHDFAAWADGKAQRRKDVVSGYRNWLDRTDDLAGIERLDGDGSPSAPPANVVPLGRKPSPSDLLRELRSGSSPTFVESTAIEESA